MAQANEGLIRTCVVCRCPTHVPTGKIPSWWSKFFALFTEEESLADQLDDIRIFPNDGSRLNEDDQPISSSSHRNDPRAELSYLQSSLVKRSSSFGSESQPPETLKSPPMLKRSWFHIHITCWHLFSAFCYPRKIDITSLKAFCVSFQDYVSSGILPIHYGQMSCPREPGATPGLERTSLLEHQFLQFYSSVNKDVYKADPLDLRELRDDNPRMRYRADDLPIKEAKAYPSGYTQEMDCFSNLPQDILELILCFLPSKDVVKLKVASPVFAALPLGGIFWASRFQQPWEFACMFDARFLPAFKGWGWQQVYRFIKSNWQSSPHFRNRERIWKTLEQIDDWLIKISKPELQGYQDPEECLPGQTSGLHILDGYEKFPSSNFHRASACFHTGRASQYDGMDCRAIHSRMVTLPVKTKGIFISWTEIENTEYISGLQFQSQDDTDTRIGYFHDDNNETYLDLTTQKSSESDGFALAGFLLAIDSRGIRGLAAVSFDETSSEMMGDSHGLPLWRVVATKKRSTANMKCEFDALKLLSIGLPRDLFEKYDRGPILMHRLQRDDYAWYPTIPDSNIHLVIGEEYRGIPGNVEARMQSYYPFTTCLFGGRKGELLPHLVKIVMNSSLSHPREIFALQFHYDKSITTDNPRVLGKIMGGEERTFPIDGAAGEVITGVMIARWDRNTSKIKQVELSTNWGRKVCFPIIRDLFPVAHHETRVQIPEGKTITGMFTYINHNCIDKELNLICEETAAVPTVNIPVRHGRSKSAQLKEKLLGVGVEEVA